MYGGVVVVHPWRLKHEEDGSSCERKDCKRYHVWMWGPHVHFIGWGRFARSDKVHKSGRGWVYRAIPDRTGRDIWATCYYQLTHCAVVPGGQSYAWVGLMSTRAVAVVKRERAWEPEVCPVCGELLMTDVYDAEAGCEVPRICLHKREIYQYKVRKKPVKMPEKYLYVTLDNFK